MGCCRRYTALDAFRVMRGRVEPGLAAAVPGAPQLLDAFEALLRPQTSGGSGSDNPADGPGGQDEAAAVNTHSGGTRSLSWPWTQAMSNIAWAVSQASGVPGWPWRLVTQRTAKWM